MIYLIVLLWIAIFTLLWWKTVQDSVILHLEKRITNLEQYIARRHYGEDQL